MHSATALVRFYDLLDSVPVVGGDIAALLGLVAEDFSWEFALPERTVSGGRAEFAEFLAQRVRTAGPDHAKHEIVMSAQQGDNELALGQVDFGDGRPGTFVVAAQTDRAGKLAQLLLRRSGQLSFVSRG